MHSHRACALTLATPSMMRRQYVRTGCMITATRFVSRIGSLIGCDHNDNRGYCDGGPSKNRRRLRKNGKVLLKPGWKTRVFDDEMPFRK